MTFRPPMRDGNSNKEPLTKEAIGMFQTLIRRRNHLAKELAQAEDGGSHLHYVRAERGALAKALDLLFKYVFGIKEADIPPKQENK